MRSSAGRIAHPADEAPGWPILIRRRRSTLATDWLASGPQTGGRGLRRPHRHLFVIVLFVIPLAPRLPDVGQRLAAPGRRPGHQLPGQLPMRSNNRFFWPSIRFTLKYTVIATILLIVARARPGPDGAGVPRWKGFLRTAFLVPSALGLASASLLFYVLYSADVGPFAAVMTSVRARPSSARRARAARRRSSSSSGGSPASTCCSCWSGCRRSPRSCTRPPRWTAPAAWQTFRDITLPLLRPRRAHADPVHHRLAAGVRAVLHPDQGRTRQHAR